jgi:hypothetical protein
MVPEALPSAPPMAERAGQSSVPQLAGIRRYVLRPTGVIALLRVDEQRF